MNKNKRLTELQKDLLYSIIRDRQSRELHEAEFRAALEKLISEHGERQGTKIWNERMMSLVDGDIMRRKERNETILREATHADYQTLGAIIGR